LSNLLSRRYPGGNGNTVKALQLAEQANALLPDYAPPGVCSWLAIVEAVEHAASNEASAYGRLVERAEEAVSQKQDESGMFGAWDETFLSGHKGTSLLLLNQPAAAEHVLLEGLKHSSLSRPRARMASSLTEVYKLQDDAESACGMGMQALGFIRDAGYVVGLQRLLTVRAEFPDDWAELSYVQEFDEQLRLAVRRLGVRGGKLFANPA
jgi:hypothetical protein